MEIITSKDNKLVKRMVLLHDRRKASREKKVFVEGVRLCEDALISGIRPEILAATPGNEKLAFELKEKYSLDKDPVFMSEEVFSKACSTVNPQGIAMVLEQPESVKELPVKGKDIYVVLENIQDPGNLGTIIRTADAFDMSAVIMTKGTADPYNEKVLRSSMGSVWKVPLMFVEDSDAAFELFSEKNITTLAAELGGDPLPEAKIDLPCAYFIGNEGNGLQTCTIDRCDRKIKIPMPGRAESLNAASAASIIGYSLSILR
ncbi:MAG: RNA methyltransferase [Clostridiales bacterium]|nr:RNA methyltransferase [Clostridiales bacterium]